MLRWQEYDSKAARSLRLRAQASIREMLLYPASPLVAPLPCCAFATIPSLSGTIYAAINLVQAGFPAPSGSAPELDAALPFIVGWVGGDSGRHSPGRLLRFGDPIRPMSHRSSARGFRLRAPRISVARQVSTTNQRLTKAAIKQRKGAKTACQPAPTGVNSREGMRTNERAEDQQS